MYIYMAESLCCAPEIITTLLTGYAPIQNKKYKKKNTITGKKTMFLTRCISLARSYFSPSGPRLFPNMIIQFHGFRYHFYAENSPFLGETPF